MSTDTVISFSPAPRAMWILFHEGELQEAPTFGLMPGWLMVDSDGIRWVAFTWMNTMASEVAQIDGDTSHVLHVWDSVNGRPTKGDVLKAMKRTGQSDDARSTVARYYDEVMGEPTTNDIPKEGDLR